MSIPGDPAVQDIILNGMKEGGQYTITAGGAAFAEFKLYQFETLKSEMWAACKTDRLLETEAVLVARTGKTQLVLPTDFDSEIRVILYDADDSYRGTLQSATADTVTLAATFSSTSELMYGRKFFTLTGSGAAQCREIIDYDDTTKVATLASALSPLADATTTYLIATVEYPLRRLDYDRTVRTANRPAVYGVLAAGMSVYPAPDKVYPMTLLYRPNLTRIDDAGAVFVKHMRERRSLWVTGVKAKTMARYDDDRHELAKAEWEAALRLYAADNVMYETVEPNR